MSTGRGKPRASMRQQDEIFEHDNTLFMRADLPGLTKENVKVQVVRRS